MKNIIKFSNGLENKMIQMIEEVIILEIDFLIENLENYSTEEIEKRLLLIKEIVKIENNKIMPAPIMPYWNKDEKIEIR